MMQIRGSTQIMAGTIVDSNIAAAAAIATTKLADGANFLKKDGSVAMTASFNAGNNTIQNVATPTNTTDAANKAYVDSLVGNGISVKSACDYMSTANITLSGLGTQAGGDWSASLTAGLRILVAGQTDATTNGIYTASSTGWTRATDFNSSTNIVPNSFVFVSKGTSYADTGWVLTTDGAVTVGTTSLTFAQFSSAGVVVAGNGLTKTGNTLSVNVGNGVQLLSNNITLKLADSTLQVSASGLALASLPSAQILVGNGSGVATPVSMTLGTAQVACFEVKADSWATLMFSDCTLQEIR
jgi:hypothetical protein